MATTLTSTNQEFVPSRWETVPCPLCGEKGGPVLERFGYQHRYTYRSCPKCGVAYQSPRPFYDTAFVETAYEVYSSDTNEHWRKGQLTEKGKIVHAEFTHIVREIEAMIGRKGRLLEIGSNTGFFLKAAADAGWHPVGVEVSRTMTEIAKKEYGVEAYSGDWVTIDFKEPFDAVYCSHVIEHVPDPASWMRRIREVLKPDGIVCISVPNMQSVDRKFKRVLKRLGIRKDRWKPWQTPDHLYEPCERSMRSFFDRMGFDTVSTYTYPSEWLGEISYKHRLMHFWLRWGAKQRYFLRLKSGT